MSAIFDINTISIYVYFNLVSLKKLVTCLFFWHWVIFVTNIIIRDSSCNLGWLDVIVNFFLFHITGFAKGIKLNQVQIFPVSPKTYWWCLSLYFQDLFFVLFSTYGKAIMNQVCFPFFLVSIVMFPIQSFSISDELLHMAYFSYLWKSGDCKMQGMITDKT